MQLTQFDAELAKNREAYERDRELIQQSGSGQFVAIAGGRTLLITPDFEEAVRAIHHLSPSPEHYLVFPADEEPIYEVIDDFEVEYTK